MAFVPSNLRPVSEHSVTQNRIWFYVTADDAIAATIAPSYFTNVSGLDLQDVVIIAATDGTATITVSAIDGGTGEVTPVLLTAAGFAADDITVDQTNLAEIGGGDLLANVQADLERLHNRLNLKVQRLANIGSGSSVAAGSEGSLEFEKEIKLRRISAGAGIAVEVVNDSIVISSTGGGGAGGGGGGGGGSGVGDDFPESLFGGAYAPWAVPASAIDTHPDNTALTAQWFDMVTKINLNTDQFAPAFYDLRDATVTANLSIAEPGFGNLSSANTVPWNPTLFQTPTDADAFVVLIDFATGLCYEFWQTSYNSGTNTVIATSGNIIRRGIEANSQGFANVLTKDNAYRPVRGCGIHHAVGPVLRREVDAGIIPHVMTVVFPKPALDAYVAPAIRGIGNPGNAGGDERLGMGYRFVWDGLTEGEIDTWVAGFASSMQTPLRVIAECARDYGFMVTDGGGNLTALIGATQLENERSGRWEDDFGMNNSTVLTALHSLLTASPSKMRFLAEPTHVDGDETKTCCYLGVNYPVGHPCFSGTPPTGGGSGGGSGGTGGSFIPPPPADLGFDSGTRLRYVTQQAGANPIGGETATTKHSTIQAAVNAALPNDVILIRSGTYREDIDLSNFAGTTGNPLWIVAEERGKVIVTNTISAAANGQANFWTNQGGGVFSRSNAARPFMGEHNGDFLFYYKTEADLRAAAVSGVSKPSYGMAFVPNGGSTSTTATGTLFVRLRGNVNPNGQKVKITANWSKNLFDLNNADNVIIDGINFEASGETEAINADTNCSNLEVRNCVFTLCKFAVRPNSGALIDCCEYLYTGFDKWAQEIAQLDGASNSGLFTLLKDYFTGTVVGGNSGNALLEAGMVPGRDPTMTGITIDRCLIGPTFDGNRLGEHDNSVVQRSVYLQCRDDGDQNESFRSANLSAGNQIHDCRFIDCHVAYSRQELSINGTSHFYRNVVENRLAAYRRNTHFQLKFIFTSDNSDDHVYQNTFINIANPGQTNNFLWYDFSNGTADRILNLKNNIVIFQNAFTNGAGPNPQGRGGNAFAGPASNSIVQANGGAYAGTTESSMNLTDDLVPTAGSPAAGIGVSIGSLPDTGTTNNDAGAFPVGSDIGPNWPREATRTFNLTKPANWPN